MLERASRTALGKWTWGALHVLSKSGRARGLWIISDKRSEVRVGRRRVCVWSYCACARGSTACASHGQVEIASQQTQPINIQRTTPTRDLWDCSSCFHSLRRPGPKHHWISLLGTRAGQSRGEDYRAVADASEQAITSAGRRAARGESRLICVLPRPRQGQAGRWLSLRPPSAL